ncbi:hypothetical protein G3M48_009626 [Beauveria asiatica]|uniref:DAPG hydrolase PhiG domain-containing protein n=1 Tax=Beauveria asiatica TaxID=1069075 RepID=A0AAW0S9F0_9HYPO
MLPSTMTWMMTAAGVVHGMALSPRQLSPAATTTGSTTIPTLENGRTVSKNFESLNNDTSSYYLGYREQDFAQPYAKYWNPVVAPLTEELISGLTSSPMAEALAFSAHQASDYLTRPGYLSLENGYTIDRNGTVIIAALSEVPEVTGDAYDWWFGWHTVQTARYKLWNPVAHQYAYRRYIGMTSFIDEYVGNDAAQLSIQFLKPESLGFNVTAWPSQGIETIVAGRVKIGGFTTTDFDNVSYLMRQVRRRPDGKRELRSRFWIAKENHGTQQLGHDLAVHCQIEMTHLGSFLPALYQEFKDTLAFIVLVLAADNDFAASLEATDDRWISLENIKGNLRPSTIGLEMESGTIDRRRALED